MTSFLSSLLNAFYCSVKISKNSKTLIFIETMKNVKFFQNFITKCLKLNLKKFEILEKLNFNLILTSEQATSIFIQIYLINFVSFFKRRTLKVQRAPRVPKHKP